MNSATQTTTGTTGTTIMTFAVEVFVNGAWRRDASTFTDREEAERLANWFENEQPTREEEAPARVVEIAPTTLKLRLGPTVDLTVNPDAVAPERIQRAFALVCPKSWGKSDWKEPVHAVLHPCDLLAADVVIGDVVEAVAFYTATACGVREVEIHAEPGVFGFVVTAKGYRAGPAW